VAIKNVVAVILTCMMAGQPVSGLAQQNPAQQPTLPDGPKPQVIPDAPRPVSLGPVTPGKGTTPDSNGASTSEDGPAVPDKLSQTAAQKDEEQEIPPDTTSGPQYVLRVQTNFVEIPFTVKDNKGNEVAGLTWRDVRVYENNLRQQLAYFTVDPFPLSVALVIDQSVSFDIMAKVNNSLGAMQGAFTPYDEVAVFTYNNGPKLVTDFTAGQSARLTQALEQSKTGGREMAYIPGGGLGSNINYNNGADSYIDPNTNSTHGRSQLGINNPPRELHTLNDAILQAAVSLSKTKTGRRRVIYVISNGNEYGSKAKYSEVVQYLNAHKIAVFGTLVGNSALWGVGFLDRMHLPLMMRDNILPAYANATGGYFMGEYRQGGIEQSFAKIAQEVRTQYTVGYYTHEPFIDGKYRNIEVKVLRPNLNVIAKKGYYPTAEDAKAPAVTPMAR
jgi:VWFA-related protein